MGRSEIVLSRRSCEQGAGHLLLLESNEDHITVRIELGSSESQPSSKATRPLSPQELLQDPTLVQFSKIFGVCPFVW